MSVLAMDTATAHCTVAFGQRRAGVFAPTGHAEHLAALIREVVPDMAAVERIVVGVGPGPYTGLRVGVVTAATMAVSCETGPWPRLCKFRRRACVRSTASDTGSAMWSS